MAAETSPASGLTSTSLPIRERSTADEPQEQKTSKRTWTLGEKLEAWMPHHEGIEALWETKWKLPCSLGVYLFHDGKLKDFEPIFKQLIADKIDDATSEEYTQAFFPRASDLVAKADSLVFTDEAELDHMKELRGLDPEKKMEVLYEKANELYLRACCLYRIARFPYIYGGRLEGEKDRLKWEAWTEQKAVYLQASEATWDVRIEEVQVPHIYQVGKDGKDDKDDRDDQGKEKEEEVFIPVYVRVPKVQPMGPPTYPCPVVILLTGLDGYRPDNTGRLNEFLKRGWGSVTLEIPGTADCPADPSDPKSMDRVFDSLFTFLAKFRDGVFDLERVMVWGLSCGGYYAVRVAHTHARQLAGVVAQGAGTHHFFDPEWLRYADRHEYPFELTPALAAKHGYDTVEEYCAKAQKKFSLLETGILSMESTRLLLVNGMDDGLMPIEDSQLCFEHGSPKEGRFFPGALHMGYPAANAVVYPWMESVMQTLS